MARRLSLILCSAIFLAACSPRGTVIPNYVERPVEVIYNNAHAELARGNFILAAQEFDEVERQRYTLKSLATGEQQSLGEGDLIAALQPRTPPQTA